ncbi:MarR family winged helix-turn-helix transcriptional regulator [Actinoplanes sp. NBRC 103695]|uniref:MarR family winged helix-turn-helix transcriptional regulator n=1 Tax=Actinoplanes sp. NBRC 103695 TaxID=3032202 RepID=UPI00255717F1|nr:MarR family winged helix-turn-helix transcriptional regulator [Actinoplanes sp. NBRC 103695]
MGRRAADASAEPGDLRHRQLIALTVLNDHGPLSQQALGELLGLDPSNLVGLLNDLEERGLTIRRRDPADRRRHIVELSPDGKAALQAGQLGLAAVEDKILCALTPAERATLHELLVRAVGADRPVALGADHSEYTNNDQHPTLSPKCD